ncbi:PREDICTED: uncharacterized protein LOC109125602 [Camelina sativa]|uniref:Uncharacterized protein LOC109125602 n=1 Tax=Camelina sativa TaxID=90675 RepID=A0ABM1Q8K1_CAMSA|nr:PREDICTED: uncharacterized protein LOC109125602 [Camelina sativa]
MKGSLWFIALLLILSLVISSCGASTQSYKIRKHLNRRTPPSDSKPAPQYLSKQERKLEKHRSVVYGLWWLDELIFKYY